eukprot:11463986-Karenia_brevis.AAC.1
MPANSLAAMGISELAMSFDEKDQNGEVVTACIHGVCPNRTEVRAACNVGWVQCQRTWRIVPSG